MNKGLEKKKRAYGNEIVAAVRCAHVNRQLKDREEYPRDAEQCWDRAEQSDKYLPKTLRMDPT